MCDDFYIMEQPLINQMYDLVLNQQQEYCIIFNFNEETRVLNFSNRYTIGTSVIGENGSERGTCVLPPKGNHIDYPYVFHSHPKNRRSYPSIEDIIKPLRHHEVNLSVVATRWGIYLIKSNDRAREDSLKYLHLDFFEHKKIYEEMIDKHLYQFWVVENHKGFYSGNNRPLNDNDIKFLRIHLNSINTKTKLEIKFCPWKDFNKEPM